MRCRGLHCGGCRSGSGSGAGVAVLAAGGVIGAVVLYRAADSAVAGLSASVAQTNRMIGAALAVVLVVAALTGAGWVLLARRRQVREAPLVADFSARVQAALDARAARGPLPIGSGQSELERRPALQRVAAYRLDAGPSRPSRPGVES